MRRASRKRQENRSQNQPHKLSLLRCIHQKHPDWSAGKAKHDATNGRLLPNPSNTKVGRPVSNHRHSSSQDQVKGQHARCALDSKHGRRISASTSRHTKATPSDSLLKLRLQGRSGTPLQRPDRSSGKTTACPPKQHRLLLNAKRRADSDSRAPDNRVRTHSR